MHSANIAATKWTIAMSIHYITFYVKPAKLLELVGFLKRINSEHKAITYHSLTTTLSLRLQVVQKNTAWT